MELFKAPVPLHLNCGQCSTLGDVKGLVVINNSHYYSCGHQEGLISALFLSKELNVPNNLGKERSHSVDRMNWEVDSTKRARRASTGGDER